jgi:hypothetical protein
MIAILSGALQTKFNTLRKRPWVAEETEIKQKSPAIAHRTFVRLAVKLPAALASTAAAAVITATTAAVSAASAATA